MTDSALVRSCLEGNMESYQTLMDRYSHQAMALALNTLANYQDAQDACQEAFLKAFRNLDRFDLERSFKNWFYALLSHVCLDQARKKNRFRQFIGRLRSDPGTTASAAALSARDPDPPSHPAMRLLGRLRPKERAAIYLWSQEGYTGAEIATVLGCTPKTAHVHLFRARTNLRAMLKEERDETR